MDVWQIILYATAGYLAIKSLSSLMTTHRDYLLGEIEAAEEQRRQEEARAQAEAAAAKKKSRRAGAA